MLNLKKKVLFVKGLSQYKEKNLNKTKISKKLKKIK